MVARMDASREQVNTTIAKYKPSVAKSYTTSARPPNGVDKAYKGFCAQSYVIPYGEGGSLRAS